MRWRGVATVSVRKQEHPPVPPLSPIDRLSVICFDHCLGGGVLGWRGWEDQGLTKNEESGSVIGKEAGEERSKQLCVRNSRVSFSVPRLLPHRSMRVCVDESTSRGRKGFREKIYECSALRDLPVKVRPALRL